MTFDERVQQLKLQRAQGLLPSGTTESTNQYSDVLNAKPQESQGWLADLIGGAINPFVDLGKMGLEGSLKGLMMLGGQKPEDYKPIFMTPSEYYGVQEHPVQTGLGAAATIGSLLIPGGEGVGGMALQGAKAGALFGGGQQLMSNKNDIASVLGSTLSGGLAGGAVGGALGLGGKLIKGLKTPAGEKPLTTYEEALRERQPRLADIPADRRAYVNEIAKSYTNNVLDNNPVAREADVIQTINDAIEYNKLKNPLTGEARTTATGEAVAKTGSKAIGNYQTPENIGKTISSMAKDVKTTADFVAEQATGFSILKKDLKAELENLVKAVPPEQKAAMNKFLEYLKGYKSVLSAKDLKDLGGLANEYFAPGLSKKMVVDTALSARQELASPVSDLIRGKFAANAETQGLIPLFDMMKTYNNVAPGVFKYIKNSPTAWILNAPVPRQLFTVPVRNAVAFTKQGVNKLTGGKGIGDIIGATSAATAPKLPAQLGILPSALANQQNKTVAPANLTQGNTALTGGGSTGGTGTSSSTTSANAMASAMGMQSGSAGRDEIIKMLASGIKPTDVKIIADLLGYSPSATKVSAAQKTQLGAIQNSFNQVDELKKIIDQNAGYFGRVQGGTLGDAFTFLFPNATRKGLQTRLEMVGQNLSKALEGSRLTDADREFYRQRIIAMLNQTPEEAKSAIDEIQQVLESQFNTLTEAYQ